MKRKKTLPLSEKGTGKGVGTKVTKKVNSNLGEERIIYSKEKEGG